MRAVLRRGRTQTWASKRTGAPLGTTSTGEWAVSGASGDFGSDWPGYQWSLQTAQRDFNVTEIVLTVTWTERGQQRSLPVATMVSDTSGTTSTGLGL